MKGRTKNEFLTWRGGGGKIIYGVYFPSSLYTVLSQAF